MRWYDEEHHGRRMRAVQRAILRALAAVGLAAVGLAAVFAAGFLTGVRFGGPLRDSALSDALPAFLSDALEDAESVEPEPEPDPNAHPLPILMYHDVVPDGTPCNDMRVTVSRLRKDFTYLRDHGYTPVLPRELLDPDSLPDKPVLITFDDGYASFYNLVYPILREYGFRAAAAPIVKMCDVSASSYCSWTALREMASSGLVEVGSHTYALHNLDNSGMVRPEGQPNGIQRRPGESDEDFKARVLDDIRKSRDRITQEIGLPPAYFAYPYGALEPDAEALIDELFPVSVVTFQATADMSKGLSRMPRWTVLMEENVVENLAG